MRNYVKCRRCKRVFVEINDLGDKFCLDCLIKNEKEEEKFIKVMEKRFSDLNNYYKVRR